jgi:hypothetical protein
MDGTTLELPLFLLATFAGAVVAGLTGFAFGLVPQNRAGAASGVGRLADRVSGHSRAISQRIDVDRRIIASIHP